MAAWETALEKKQITHFGWDHEADCFLDRQVPAPAFGPSRVSTFVPRSASSYVIIIFILLFGGFFSGVGYLCEESTNLANIANHAVADRYPSATVEGVDLSAIQPTYVPPNLKFIVDDIEGEWIYPPNSMDYIHMRHVAQTIRNKPQLLERAYE